MHDVFDSGVALSCSMMAFLNVLVLTTEKPTRRACMVLMADAIFALGWALVTLGAMS